MLRTVTMALAVLALSGCASFMPRSSASLLQSPASRQADWCTMDSAISAPCDRTINDARVMMTAISLQLTRRAFSPPSRRQPDMRPVFATTTDWRQWRRHGLMRRERRVRCAR